MNHYIYEGPIMKFGDCIVSRWYGSTYAVSEAKARSNFKHQVKQKLHYISGTRIDLPGKIKQVEK